MKKILIIVESPVKAVKIQSFLGDKYKVIASYGHIADLAKGGTNSIGVDTDREFKTKYVLLQDKVAVLTEILNEAINSSLILIASDGDREGEAIAWHIKSRLGGITAPIKRIVFNEIKKSTVLKAIKNPRDIDLNIFNAQETRRVLDRIVGFMASPFLMSTMGPNLSAGRVQSVVTKMIVEQEKLISAFVPEDFWNLFVDLKLQDGSVFNAKVDVRPTTEDDAKEIYQKITKSKNNVVSDVKSKVEYIEAPAPMVTSTLQRMMSKKYGMSADRTMKAAQSLYEQGYCTYIRTDSVRSSDESIDEAREYLKNNNFSVSKTVNTFSNKNISQDAHECIRPSDINVSPVTSMLTDPDQKMVYEIIYRYFMASQMSPAVYNTLKVTVKSNDFPELLFKSSGKALADPGYMVMLNVSDDSKILIPNMSVGDAVKITKINVEKKQTKAPPRFSEDKLIKELENKNIGRPATYAELLSKISVRNYVEKQGSVFHPTELGYKVTDSLNKYFSFMDYNYTANLEKKLDEIELGNISKLEVLESFFNEFKNQLSLAYVENGGTLCTKCGYPMVTRENKSNQEKFLACSHYPNCRNTVKI